MAKKPQRFDVLLSEGSEFGETGHRYILVDRETGVNYLMFKSGYAGGITPLLDREGKPIITAIRKYDME